METIASIPITRISRVQIFKSLFRADLAVQRRRMSIIVIVVMISIMMLFAWKTLSQKLGFDAPYVLLSACVSFVMVNIGLLSYPGTLALDRDRGVFQKLRTTPATTSLIMASRIAIQILVVMFASLVVMLTARYTNHITLSTHAYVWATLVSILCSLVYLSFGQMLAAFIQSSNTLSSVGRSLFLILAVGGAMAEFNLFGTLVKNITEWSPYGIVNTLLSQSMHSNESMAHILLSVGVAGIYVLVFSILGIRRFKWQAR